MKKLFVLSVFFLVLLFQNCSDNSPKFTHKGSTSSSENSSSSTTVDESSVDDDNSSNGTMPFPGEKKETGASLPPPNNTPATIQPGTPFIGLPSQLVGGAVTTPGAHCNYIKNLNGLGFGQLQIDFIAAFEIYKVGQTFVYGQANAKLTRIDGDAFSYVDEANPANNFIIKKTDSPKTVALKNHDIHMQWMRQYGVRFGITAIQLSGAAAQLDHLFGYPMGANKSFPLGFLNLTVTTAATPGSYTFHTPDGPMSSTQFLGSTWCLAMTSDWGQSD